tara:strand:+ start:9220 stop:11244 length:2025 start_codon:yes stop_codon:yes gene_type:complete
MKLLYPDFLYALFFLAIPIIIHLFNFRKYKTVRFSQVRFLKNIKQETQSTSKLKHLLILLSRLLAIAALVLAFCQPYLSNEGTVVQKGKKGVSIYIDNSFSMQINSEKGTNLDIAKAKALAILDAYKESDQFKILTNDFSSRHSQWLNKADFISELQNVNYSPIYKKWSEVLSRMTQNYGDEQLTQELYLITDLQKNQVDFRSIMDTVPLNIIPIEADRNLNLNLASLKFAQPFHLTDQEEKLSYTIQNQFKTKTEQLPVSLFINNQLKSPHFIDLEENDSTLGQMNYRSGELSQVKGKLIIKDYPLTFDDTLYFNYSIQENINVVHLFNELPNKNIQTLFAKDTLFNYTAQKIDEIDYSLIQKPALIILDEITELSSGLQSTLQNFVLDGGSLALFPSAKIEKETWSNFLNQLGLGSVINYETKDKNVTQINKKADLFSSVFESLDENINLPKVKGKWTYNLATRLISEPILSFSDNSPFLLKASVGEGKVYLSAVGFNTDESNLVNHGLFVPLLFNMALQSGSSKPLYYNLNHTSIEISSSKLDAKKEAALHIIGNGQDFIPAQRYIKGKLVLDLTDELKQAGHYELVKGDQSLGFISFNYNRNESDLQFYSSGELEAEAKIHGQSIKIIDEPAAVLSNAISTLQEGTPLWKYFIILALFFIALEILFLRIL